MHQSNKVQYYFLKYGFISFAVFILVLVGGLILTNSEVRIKGVKESATLQNGYPFLIVSLIIGSLGVYLKNKVKFVKLSGTNIELSDSKYNRLGNWEDIEKIRLLKFVTPPIYSIKFLDEDKTHLFVTGNSYMSFSLFTWDLSDMGKIIKRKKTEFGL